MRGTLLCLGLSLTAAGCFRAVSVSRDAQKPHSVAGIPFYIKKAGCRHEKVWLEPVYVLTMDSVRKTAQGEEITALGNAVVPLESKAAVDHLKGALQNKDVSQDKVQQEWDAIKQHSFNPLEQEFPARPDANYVLASDTTASETYVDYGEVYYYNAKRPWAGSTNLAFKLAPDGTMSEGSAQVESKTLETFLGLIPVKEAISKVAGITPKALLPTVQLRLTVETKIYKHTLYKITPSSSFPCAPQQEMTPPYNYVREELSGKTADSANDGKTKKRITFAGEAVLPEDKKKPD